MTELTLSHSFHRSPYGSLLLHRVPSRRDRASPDSMDGKGKGERKETRKKITIIDNMIPGTLGNSLGSLLPPVILSSRRLRFSPLSSPSGAYATRREAVKRREVVKEKARAGRNRQ